MTNKTEVATRFQLGHHLIWQVRDAGYVCYCMKLSADRK